ncbi:MAG: FKBP-type peptidyl-prolyl cis-trans isomerase [Bacteroidaceae bacterium]|nr:FKBP-type peptidyl-prolyl cis-trans isomerase [Bacteroidaceae bacterium]
MMATKNNYITVAYKLYVSDNEDIKEDLVEECNAEHPFQFISHLGAVLPAFENEIDKLKAGDPFDFVIKCKDAYGEFDEKLMFDVPKSTFFLNGKFDDEHIYEGNIIPLQAEDGSRFNGTVIEVKENDVTIDLNHPRAGQDLHFVGTVITHREATNDEVTGLIRMLSGEGCGCGCHGGCDDCGGGCDDCGCEDHDHNHEGCNCGHHH